MTLQLPYPRRLLLQNSLSLHSLQQYPGSLSVGSSKRVGSYPDLLAQRSHIFLIPLSVLPPVQSHPETYVLALPQETAFWGLLSSLHPQNSFKAEIHKSLPMGTIAKTLYGDLPEVPDYKIESHEDLFLHGSSYEKARESLRILFYYFSNNLGASNLDAKFFWEDENFWAGLQCVFEATGMLRRPPPFDLRECREDHTISASCEKLFTALIYTLTDDPYPFIDTRQEFCLEVVRWLLQAGQDPNVRFSLYDHEYENYPIGLAAYSVHVKLIKLLLQFGANPNLTHAVWAVLWQKYDTYEAGCSDTDEDGNSLMGESQKNMSNPDSDENTIFELLVGSTPHNEEIVRLDRCLLRSLESGDIYISRRLCHLGANLRCREDITISVDRFGLLRSTTAMSAISAFKAAPEAWSGSSPPPVQFVIDMLRDLDVDVLSDHFVMADAFISATLSENHDTLRYLVSIGADINSLNELGVTPLHAAACLESGTTCKLLLHLGANPNTTSHGFPSPLHIACNAVNVDIATILISAGANPDDRVNPATLSQFAHRSFGPMKDIWNISVKEAVWTPLEILTATGRIKDAVTLIGRDLIAAGAMITHSVLINVVKLSHVDLLRMCLRSGYGSDLMPDYTMSRPSVFDSTYTSKGSSILQLALERGDAGCSFLILRDGAKATWDELCTAGALVREKPWTEDTALVSQVVRNSLPMMFERCGPPPPGSLFLSLFWHGTMQSIPGLFEFRPYDYCSVGLLMATLVFLKTNDWSLVRFLLGERQKTDRQASDVFEGTSVAVAAMSGDPELLRLLLLSLPPTRCCAISRSAPLAVWADSTKPFDVVAIVQDTIASAFFSPETLRFASPIILPIVAGQIDAVVRMMSVGYQPDTLSLLHAMTNGTPSLVKTIISGHHRHLPMPVDDVWSGWGLLFGAVEAGSDEMLQLLLNDGITGYESSGRIALCEAIKRGENSMTDMLLIAGAGIHDPAVCSRQRTALQQAVESRNLDVTRRLLDAGVDVNQAPAPRYGATALQLAAINGQMGVAKLLLEKGAHVNAPGSKKGGRTALEGAAEYGRLDMAQMLLEQGFDTTGRQGRIAYVKAVAYTRERRHIALEHMLRKHRTWTELDEWLDDNLILFEDNTFDIDPMLVDTCNWDEMASSPYLESMDLT